MVENVDRFYHPTATDKAMGTHIPDRQTDRARRIQTKHRKTAPRQPDVMCTDTHSVTHIAKHQPAYDSPPAPLHSSAGRWMLQDWVRSYEWHTYLHVRRMQDAAPSHTDMLYTNRYQIEMCAHPPQTHVCVYMYRNGMAWQGATDTTQGDPAEKHERERERGMAGSRTQQGLCACSCVSRQKAHPSTHQPVLEKLGKQHPATHMTVAPRTPFFLNRSAHHNTCTDARTWYKFVHK